MSNGYVLYNFNSNNIIIYLFSYIGESLKFKEPYLLLFLRLLIQLLYWINLLPSKVLPGQEKKFITVWISFLDDTENWE